jgi:hypothetical protein
VPSVDEGGGVPSDGDWRPRPDPTILTTEQLHREINSLESRIAVEAAALKALLEASIAAVTATMETKVSAHHELDHERFSRIDTRFDTVERHRVEEKQDTNNRLNYVINTLKERADEHFKQNSALIEKSEQSILDTISKQGDSFKTTTDANLGRIDDLKERVGKIESIKEGALEQKTESRAQISGTTAIIGTIIAIVGIGLALLIGRNQNQAPVTVTVPTVTVEQPATRP